MAIKGFQLKSKMQGFQMAQRKHVCLDCCYHQPKTFVSCPECGSKNRQYFMSDKEHRRGMTLLMLQRAGTISRLRFQPRFSLDVGGQKLGAYVGDFDYYKDGVYMVEDVKGHEDHMDSLSAWKIKHMLAQYGIEVFVNAS